MTVDQFVGAFFVLGIALAWTAILRLIRRLRNHEGPGTGSETIADSQHPHWKNMKEYDT